MPNGCYADEADIRFRARLAGQRDLAAIQTKGLSVRIGVGASPLTKIIEDTKPLWCTSGMRTIKHEASVEPANIQTVKIRVANALDIPKITRLLWDDQQGRQRESVSQEDSATYLSAFKLIEKDPNSQVFVAIKNDAVIGCLQLTVISGLSYRGVRRALVEDVRVERSCRGIGIGGLLLAHAEAHASKLGCRLMELFVHAERKDAHRFYERAGYSGEHRGFRKSLAPA